MKAFNPKNGQVYSETTSSCMKSMLPAWKRRTTGRRVNPTTYKSKGQGCSSLRRMALRLCCWNIELFLPEALQYPGWHYAGMIYQLLKATDSLSFAAWTLFHQAYPDQPEISHQFRIGHGDSTTDWPSITKSLSGLSSSVITHFCAHNINLDRSQLLSLTNIPALVALVHINMSEPHLRRNGLSRSDFRDWTRAVHEKRAFKKLKLLFMSLMSDHGPTEADITRNLSAFPALVLTGVGHTWNFVFDTQKDHSGWVYPDLGDEDKYKRAIWDSRSSIAEKTERLYRYVKGISQRDQSLDGPVTLSFTCAARGPDPRDSMTIWFIRDPASTDLQPKRSQEVKTVRDGSGRTTKKRKVRQGMHQDVGKLLGTFG